MAEASVLNNEERKNQNLIDVEPDNHILTEGEIEMAQDRIYKKHPLAHNNLGKVFPWLRCCLKCKPKTNLYKLLPEEQVRREDNLHQKLERYEKKAEFKGFEDGMDFTGKGLDDPSTKLLREAHEKGIAYDP